MTSFCGVYQIKNIVTGDYYIGSSCNLRQRICDHRRRFANNQHENSHLQRAWNKYGEQAFEFKVLLLCDVERKLSIEQGFIDLFKPAYNIAKDAKAPMQGRHHTDEMKRHMSEALKGKPSGMLGKHLSEETKRKMSEIHTGKPNSALGKHLSEEVKRNMSEGAKRYRADKRLQLELAITKVMADRRLQVVGQ